MKKFFIPVILLISLLSGCGSSNDSSNSTPSNDEMPKMYVDVAGKSHKSTQGSYCWKASNQAGCADASGNPFDYIEYAPPIQVKKGDSITLKFSAEPNSITVDLHNEDNSVEAIGDSPLSAPKEAGLYGYSVFTKWKQGDIQFFFVMDVQK